MMTAAWMVMMERQMGDMKAAIQTMQVMRMLQELQAAQ